MGDAALEPSLVGVPALHAGDDDLGKITTDVQNMQKDIASSISSTASTAIDGTKAGREEAMAGRGEHTLEIPLKEAPLGIPRSTSSLTQPDSPALGGGKTLVAADAKTPARRQSLQQLLPRPIATETGRDGGAGEGKVGGLLSSPTGAAAAAAAAVGGTADAGAVVSDSTSRVSSETAAADGTPVDASLSPPRNLSVSWSEISLHLDDETEGGRKEATMTAKDGGSTSPVRALSSTTPPFWAVRGEGSSSNAFGSSRSATSSRKVLDMFQMIRNATGGSYASSGSGLFGGRGKAAAVSDVSLSPDEEIAPEHAASTREYFEAMGSSPARRLPALSPLRSGPFGGNGKNSSGPYNDDGFPEADELDGDMDGGGLAGGGGGALTGRSIMDQSPLITPPHSHPFYRSPGTSSATVSPMVSAAARARLEAEVDVEEGFAWATSAKASTAVVAGVETGAPQVVAGADGQSLVLPCPPSDEEKVIYHNTGRFGLVTCAMISFVTLTWGMWLFTIVTPAFYWFGAPAIFVIVYTACHYLGVAIWGRDFKPEVHAEVLKASEEKGYRPSVDVFLPVCKEPLHLLANTWQYVAALDYPDLKVFVLDDGASDEVKALASTFGFEYVLRADVPALKKAGNLRNAFARTSGEAIAIFDADFCPRADFLKETVPYFGEDPTIGIVQTPQYFRHRKEQTWVEQGAGVSQEFFYRMVQMNQDRFNAAVCVGSCGLYRRAALEPLGGMAAIEHSEDMYTGFKMTENGFTIKYVPLALAMGICPDEPQSFFMQQYRWCKGSATLVREKEFWMSNISPRHKLCFLNGLLYYMATALLIFMAPLPIMLLVWVEADGVLWYHSGFVLPSLIFAGIVLPLWSKQHYGMSSHRIKIIQYYAHLFAIKDSLLGVSAPWVPSGVSRSSSSRYKSSVRLMVAWSILSTALIVGGCAWRMTMITWYHFVPAMAFAVGSFVLNMSTLVY
ncbi:unnamed protein product [Ectocarpus fasciculatus]